MKTINCILGLAPLRPRRLASALVNYLVTALAVAGLGIGPIGCKKGEEGEHSKPAASPPTGAAGDAATAREPEKVSRAQQPAFDAAKFGKHLLSLSQCKIVEHAVDYECPTYREAVTALEQIPGEHFVPFAKKYLAHPQPAVRLRAAYMFVIVAAAGQKLQVVLERIHKETHPAVIARLLSGVGVYGVDHPEIAALLHEMAGHSSYLVRKVAAEYLGFKGLSGRWSREV